EQRTQQIKERWSRVCEDAAPPTRVLWTFLDERLGPSPVGWELEGIAWPDPPKTRRKLPPVTELLVDEAWRCGDPKIDQMRGIIPAIVVGSLVQCHHATTPAPGGPIRLAGLDRVALNPILARRLAALTAHADAPKIARVNTLAAAGASARALTK